jgi:hypothetical protein
MPVDVDLSLVKLVQANGLEYQEEAEPEKSIIDRIIDFFADSENRMFFFIACGVFGATILIVAYLVHYSKKTNAETRKVRCRERNAWYRSTNAYTARKRESSVMSDDLCGDKVVDCLVETFPSLRDDDDSACTRGQFTLKTRDVQSKDCNIWDCCVGAGPVKVRSVPYIPQRRPYPYPATIYENGDSFETQGISLDINSPSKRRY